MRLGIVFQGECRNKDNVVRAVQRMAKEKGYRVGAWKEGMRVVLCPTGYVDLGWDPGPELFWPVEDHRQLRQRARGPRLSPGGGGADPGAG